MPYGRLQIDEDLRFQHRLWRIQRAGWMVMGLVLITGVVGLLGKARSVVEPLIL